MKSFCSCMLLQRHVDEVNGSGRLLSFVQVSSVFLLGKEQPCPESQAPILPLVSSSSWFFGQNISGCFTTFPASPNRSFFSSLPIFSFKVFARSSIAAAWSLADCSRPCSCASSMACYTSRFVPSPKSGILGLRYHAKMATAAAQLFSLEAKEAFGCPHVDLYMA